MRGPSSPTVPWCHCRARELVHEPQPVVNPWLITGSDVLQTGQRQRHHGDRRSATRRRRAPQHTTMTDTTRYETAASSWGQAPPRYDCGPQPHMPHLMTSAAGGWPTCADSILSTPSGCSCGPSAGPGPSSPSTPDSASPARSLRTSAAPGEARCPGPTHPGRVSAASSGTPARRPSCPLAHPNPAGPAQDTHQAPRTAGPHPATTLKANGEGATTGSMTSVRCDRSWSARISPRLRRSCGRGWTRGPGRPGRARRPEPEILSSQDRERADLTA